MAGRECQEPVVRDRRRSRHPRAGSRGRAVSHGSRFGGHALYVKDNRLHYVDNYVGIDEQIIIGTDDVPTGDDLILSASFEKEGQDALSANGTLSLYHGETKVGEGKIKTQLGAFAIAGAGVYVGRHAGEPLTDDYPGTAPFAFTGGTVKVVSVNVTGAPYLDIERHAAMLLKQQ